MTILSVQTALPDHCYEQDELLAALSRQWGGALHNPHRLAQLFANMCVGGRCLALPLERYAALKDFSATNAAYVETALQLGGRAIVGACQQAGIAPGQLSHLLFVTSTGLATPSIDALLVGQLGLDAQLRRTPIFGLGCMAGAGGLARMADFLRAHPQELGLVLSVELCSLTLQQDDLSVANLISSGLFGDGAAAVLMAGAEHPLAAASPGPRILASRSMLYPDSEHVMGWEIGSQGFRVVLSAEVPAMVSRYLRRDVDAFLAEHQLCIGDLKAVIAHPGGPKVLEAMEHALDLPRTAFERSWHSLSSVGNLSSASVLFILGDTLNAISPHAGDTALLLAMGPGFCSELVLLKW